MVYLACLAVEDLNTDLKELIERHGHKLREEVESVKWRIPK